MLSPPTRAIDILRFVIVRRLSIFDQIVLLTLIPSPRGATGLFPAGVYATGNGNTQVTEVGAG